MSSSTGTAISAPEFEVPCEKTMYHAARLALEKDMPIHLDYYLDTKSGKAFLGEDSTTKDQMLVRSEDEYTSPISKTFKVKENFIVVTENSIYIISGNVKKKFITNPGVSA